MSFSQRWGHNSTPGSLCLVSLDIENEGYFKDTFFLLKTVATSFMSFKVERRQGLLSDIYMYICNYIIIYKIYIKLYILLLIYILMFLLADTAGSRKCRRLAMAR